MKKTLLATLMLVSSLACRAQNLSFNQVNSLFDTWKLNRGTSTSALLNKLHTISTKWKAYQHQDAGETKTYAWIAVDSKKDSLAVVATVEEDNETIKYSVEYLFYDAATYLSAHQFLKSSNDYKGRVTSFTDNSKGESSITAMGNDSMPMKDRTDIFLTIKGVNSNYKQYSITLASRYIKK